MSCGPQPPRAAVDQGPHPTRDLHPPAMWGPCTIQCGSTHEANGAIPPSDDLLFCTDARGELDGPWVMWEPDGSLSECGVYRRGQRHGWWKYFEKGRLTKSIEYIDGARAPLLSVSVKDEAGVAVIAVVSLEMTIMRNNTPSTLRWRRIATEREGAAFPLPQTGKVTGIVDGRLLVRMSDLKQFSAPSVPFEAEVSADAVTRIVVSI